MSEAQLKDYDTQNFQTLCDAFSNDQVALLSVKHIQSGEHHPLIVIVEKHINQTTNEVEYEFKPIARLFQFGNDANNPYNAYEQP